MTDLKFAMLMTLIAGIAEDREYQNEGDARLTRLVETSFVSALACPDLLETMQQQLDPDFLDRDQQLFIGEVVFDSTLFRMVGSYDQWHAFFSGRWDLLFGWYGDIMSHS